MRRRRDTKHVTQREEDGRAGLGPAVARMSRQCAIGASILMEAGPGPPPGGKSFFLCVSLRVCACVSVCTMLVKGSVRRNSGGGSQ